MSDQINRWIAFALDDLRVAELVFDEEIYAQTCFHSQQCAEKALKASLLYLGESVPRVHSIVTLSGLLPSDL